MALFYIFEETHTKGPSISTSSVYPKETFAHLHYEKYVRIFTEAFIIITPDRKQLIGSFCTQSKERETEKRGRSLQTSSWSFFKSKGTYLLGLCWVATRGLDLCTTHQKLNAYVESLTWFSHIHCPDGLKLIFLS